MRTRRFEQAAVKARLSVRQRRIVAGFDRLVTRPGHNHLLGLGDPSGRIGQSQTGEPDGH
jgi:hypothetical protein